jgi:hypothetical protein
MTPIVTTRHPNPDRRWSSTGDAAARPNALIVDGLKLPSAISTAAKILSSRFEAGIDRIAATVSNGIIPSAHADRSHFPHRRRQYPA